MKEQGFISYIKTAVKKAGMTGKLIAISVGVSLFFGILMIVENLFVVEHLSIYIKTYFAAPGNPEQLIYQPWSIITQLFTHGDIGHLFFNMIMLYFSGQIFVQFFGEKRLLTTYLIGGIFAYLFHVGAYYTFPRFSGMMTPMILGASGAIAAVFTAVVIHKPQLKVQLFLLKVSIPITLVFLVFVIFSLRGLMFSNVNDNTAYFAHIGGIVFGALSLININSPKNFMNRFERWLSKFKWPKLSFKRKPKMKVHRSDANQMTDDEYNSSRKDNQERIDAILDKISKKGYEGLTKEEKDILFNESKRK